MKPAFDKTYRFRFREVDDNHIPLGPEYVTTLYVTDRGTVPVMWGPLAWDEEGDMFRNGAVGLRCLGNGHFIAINGARNYEGTCEEVV